MIFKGLFINNNQVQAARNDQINEAKHYNVRVQLNFTDRANSIQQCVRTLVDQGQCEISFRTLRQKFLNSITNCFFNRHEKSFKVKHLFVPRFGSEVDRFGVSG